MEKVVIKASKRTVTGKQVHALRRAGQLPAVLYGHNVDPIAISMDTRESVRTLSRLTASSLVTIDLDGKEYPALVREKQINYIKRNLIHVDFQVISLTEKIRTRIGIELTGLSPAVKDYNAVLVSGITDLEVECFPQDLPERIVVDVSNLLKIGDSVRIHDIVLSEKVHVMSETNEMIVLATAPKVEVVEEVTAEAAVVAESTEPEVLEKGKKEEEEEKK